MPNMYTVMHACIAHSCSALDVPLGLPWAPSGRRSDYMVSCLAMAHKAPQHSAMVACTVKSNIEQCYDINKMRLEQCYDINSALRAQHSDIAFSFTLLLANWAFRAPGAPWAVLGPQIIPLGAIGLHPSKTFVFLMNLVTWARLGLSFSAQLALFGSLGLPLGPPWANLWDLSGPQGAGFHSPE